MRFAGRKNRGVYSGLCLERCDCKDDIVNMASDGASAEAQGKLVMVAVDGSDQADEALECKDRERRRCQRITASQGSLSLSIYVVVDGCNVGW